jgi:hypothetical protein
MKQVYSGPSNLYIIVSIAYILIYAILGLVLFAYLGKNHDIQIAVYFVPFILFRFFYAIFALTLYNQARRRCCWCFLWFGILVVFLQGFLHVVAFTIQVIALGSTALPRLALAVIDLLLSLYILWTPLHQTSNTYYMMVAYGIEYP